MTKPKSAATWQPVIHRFHRRPLGQPGRVDLDRAVTGPWREPGEESTDLYPGLVVADGIHSRVSGSITFGPTRTPLWAVPVEFSTAASDYGAAPKNVKAAEEFVGNLLELRGEFGRLLLVLADEERREYTRRGHRAWWDRPRSRKRVADQLRRCLAAVE